MAEQEVPLEVLQEEIHHRAEHSEQSASHGSEVPRKDWVLGVAVSTAVIVALTAGASFLASDHVNEAMIELIHSSDNWNHYQAKGIKSLVLDSKLDILESLNRPVPKEERGKVSEYSQEQKHIKEEAERNENSSTKHLRLHVILSRAVTLFQVSIAVSAIAVLTRRKSLWFLGLGFGLFGLFSMIQGIL